VRAGLAIPRRLQQEQSCCLLGGGWFLDLPYRVVAIRQVLNTGDANHTRQHGCPAAREPRARRAASLACAAVTPLCCDLNFFAPYDASTCSNPPPQRISFATAAPQIEQVHHSNF